MHLLVNCHKLFLTIRLEHSCLTSALRREVEEICALLGCYSAYSGTTYRPHPDPCQMGRTGCPETSVRNYHCMLHNSPKERSSRIHVCLCVSEVSIRKLFVSILETEGGPAVDKMSKVGTSRFLMSPH